MLKSFAMAALPLAVLGFASAAMAVAPVSSSGGSVAVNIQVAKVVSMWANDPSINLTMNGYDGNNTAWANSSLSVINNTNSKVDATVTGSLPAPIVPGGGIYFHIFDNQPADVPALFQLNAYGNANAKTWTNTNLGSTQTLFASTGIHTSIQNFPITYAVTAPGEIPLPNTYNLLVTYTITETP